MSQKPFPKSNQQRLTVLAPYLMQLRALQAGRERIDDVKLDPWESSVVAAINTSTNAPDHEWSSLVAEGIAFRTKYESDIQRLGNDPDAVDLVRAQLVTDAAVGLALMAETQQSVNLMVLSGEIDTAKKLSGFRNKIVQGVSTIKNTIGETAFRNAETLSKKMTSVSGEPSRSDPASASEPRAPESLATEKGADELPYLGEPLDVDSLIGELPDAFIRRRTKPTRPTVLRASGVDDAAPRRLKGLAVVLAALVVIWAVLILPRLGRGGSLPILTEQSIPQSTAIRELIARPPSLYVEVDAVEWKTMSSAERRQLVKEVGEVAKASGYTGVQFRDTDGSSVAQWLRSQGVWLANAAL